ncbi:MAG: hypothetical protein K1X81_02030 [Bacteroidia bacterium]|nr:hypothetical protein [Bacteroidia bacterium]
MNIQERITAMVGVSADDYARLVFETGIEYAGMLTGGNEQAVSRVIQTKTFWKWFKNQWQQIDEVFLAAYRIADRNDSDVRESLRLMWIEEHNPEAIKAKPVKQVVDEVNRALMACRKEAVHA